MFDDYYVRGPGISAPTLPPAETRAEARMDDDGGAMLPVSPRNPSEIERIRQESLPDDNPKSKFGTKKAPTFSVIPMSAILVEGQVMALGAAKYGPFNWREKNVAASVYLDAAMRHLVALNAGEDNDPESLVSHAGHVRACMGIFIDAIEQGCLIDDRPKNKGELELLKRYTRN